MTERFRKFLLQNIMVILILGVIGGILFLFFIPEYFHFAYPLVLILSFGVNILAYFIFSRSKKSSGKSMAQVSQLFAIKFFYYLAVAVIFLILLPEKKDKITFVIVLFIIYIAFSLLEVQALTRFVKSEENNS